jgi:threonylcarbamoyladenosine tRNA methylthiotransferase CDKAL1
VVVAGCVP